MVVKFEADQVYFKFIFKFNQHQKMSILPTLGVLENPVG